MIPQKPLAHPYSIPRQRSAVALAVLLILALFQAPATAQILTDVVVIDRDGVPYVDLEQLADALGVKMEYDEVFNWATLGRGTDDTFIFMPGFQSFRHRGKIVNSEQTPVKTGDRILVPLSMAEDYIIPEFNGGPPASRMTPRSNVSPSPTPTVNPYLHLFGITPEPKEPKEPMEPAGPTEPVPTTPPYIGTTGVYGATGTVPDSTGFQDPDLPPRQARTPAEFTGAPLPTPTPFRVASNINIEPFEGSGEEIEAGDLDVVFLDLKPLDQDAATFLQSISGTLQRRLQNEARVAVAVPQSIEGEPPTDAQIAEQANAAGANLLLSLRVQMTDQPFTYVLYHYSPLVAPLGQRPNADPVFGQRWGMPDENRARVSAAFAGYLTRHFTQILEEPGLGTRQGRLDLLKGARMPAILADLRLDRLLAGRVATQDGLVDAIVFAVVDIKNQMEGMPAVPHY